MNTSNSSTGGKLLICTEKQMTKGLKDYLFLPFVCSLYYGATTALNKGSDISE